MQPPDDCFGERASRACSGRAPPARLERRVLAHDRAVGEAAQMEHGERAHVDEPRDALRGRPRRRVACRDRPALVLFRAPSWSPTW